MTLNCLGHHVGGPGRPSNGHPCSGSVCAVADILSPYCCTPAMRSKRLSPAQHACCKHSLFRAGMPGSACGTSADSPGNRCKSMLNFLLGREASSDVMTRTVVLLHPGVVAHLRAAAYLSLSLRPPFSASLRRTLSLSLFAFARTCRAGSTDITTGYV